MTKERTKLDAALAPPGAQTVLPRLLRRVQAQEPAHHGRVAGLGMGIDLEHQFFLPILAFLAYPVEASRSEMSAPFSKIIKCAMEKLLGSDVHERALARLIEVLD